LETNVDFSTVVPADQMTGGDAEETELLRGMLEEAQEFLGAFDWCQSIEESFFGLGVGGVVAVFLFRIRPKRNGIDDLLWVVVGDLPPAYLVTDNSPSPNLALEGYVELMSEWVKAAADGTPIDKLIPVNVAPTPENAKLLESRLAFLSKEIIPLLPRF
jgi:hypothetical protein